MTIKKGLKVVIAKNLGPKNERDKGDNDDYYFADAESVNEVELGSKGTVSRVKGNKVYVTLEDSDDERPFHKDELKFPGQNTNDNSLGKLPQQYVFGLASQMPIFLINDRVYSLDEHQGNLRSNFFQTSDNGSSARRGLIESVTLASLEELTRAHHAKEYDKLERKYLQEVVEERSHSGDGSSSKLVDFIVNEVFPYFKRDGQSSARIGKLLGVRTSVTEDKTGKSKSHKPKGQSREETFVSKLIDGIEREKFQRDGDEERKTKKLDTLLGYDPRWDVTEFPKDYDPTSILGQVLAGRNVAVVDNVFYNLVWTNSNEHRRVLNFGGKNFALVSPKPMDEVKARYDFELSKGVRVGALRHKLTQDEQLKVLAQRNTNLGELVKKREYHEGEFGFIRDEDDWCDEDSGEDHSGLSYLVFLQVPKHALKAPKGYNSDDEDEYDDNGRKRKPQESCYWFDKTRAAVRVFLNDDGNITYDKPVTVEDYKHPFMTSETGICLGDYSFNKLNKLKRGEAVARLLVDTKQTFLSGYTRANTPAAQELNEFDNRRLTLSEARRRNIPVTNINIERGRRRR
ncbi:MAG: hypothetical protein Q8N63_03665 [Nanoarchaeota archaeon]|nr:hypothetical protein [Nanoarchaeota archaeon]